MVFQERTYSVLLVSAGEKFSRALSGLLPPTDYFPIATARSADEARRRLLGASYDLVLINAPLPDELGSRLATDVCSGSEAGVLLLVGSELYREVCAQVTEYGVLAVSKPTSSQPLAIPSGRFAPYGSGCGGRGKSRPLWRTKSRKYAW